MTTGVLVMAYGSPASSDEVEPYLKNIRGGREPSQEAVDELTQRYEAVGWSPLLEITERQSLALEKTLVGDFKTYVGMKHWHPFIPAAVRQMSDDGVQRIIGLVLAPHYSKMSIGGYESRLHKALQEIGGSIPFVMIPRWYAEPSFVDFVAANILHTLHGWSLDDRSTRVFFTAHSLPEKIIEEGDPYKDDLLESSRLISAKAGLHHWEFAFQSASHTGIPWLGPDVIESLQKFASEGGKRALIAPIGFVSDHLEILYDVDIECVDKARDLGLDLRRIPSPNDDDRFIEALASVVRRFVP